MATELQLPAGQYRLAIIDPTRPGHYPVEIDRRQVSIELEGWTPERIEKNRETLAGYNRTRAMVIRPMAEERAVVGFRNVESKQLAAMRRDGFEPDWVVKVGERFDVLLRAHAPLTEDESRQLKYHLAAKYELTLPRGVYRDAVRLPGFEAERAKPESRAVLVEASGREFQASERVVTQLRNREEQIAIARWARAQSLSAWAERQPVTTLADGDRVSPRLPASHPVARFQSQLQEAVAVARPANAFHEHSDSALERVALAAHREILERLVDRQPLDLEKLPAFRELARVESVLVERGTDRADRLLGEESWVSQCRRDVACAARDLGKEPDAETFETYSHRVVEAFHAEQSWSSERFDTFLAGEVRDSLAVDRLAAAVVISPRDERVLEAFRVGAEREAHSILRRGEALMPADLAAGTLPELKEALESLRAKERSIHSELKASEAGTGEEISKKVGEWRGVVVERVDLEQKVRFGELGQELAASRLAERAAPVTEPDFARALLTRFCQQLGQWNAAAPAASTNAWSPELFQRVLAQVAHGDVSPRALGQLQSVLLPQVHRERMLGLAPPLPQGDALDLLRRFVKLEQEIRPLAAEVSRVPDWVDGGATLLLRKSVEMVQVHQAVEKLERRLHGVAEPSVAPEGISQASWDRAWLKRAEEKGLAHPERHLGNIGPALAPRELAMERAVALGKVEGQAVRAVTKEVERRMTLR